MAGENKCCTQCNCKTIHPDHVKRGLWDIIKHIPMKRVLTKGVFDKTRFLNEVKEAIKQYEERMERKDRPSVES